MCGAGVGFWCWLQLVLAVALRQEDSGGVSTLRPYPGRDFGPARLGIIRENMDMRRGRRAGSLGGSEEVV